ncbi:HetP family heterocyst commitment protein [Pseudanabaenaceae cyanobacterium LEGE 13415]|nr:HetP family heterocyst commitment protein [Pseudanabaenaceae cyanobacterium LEGE 13415]
MNPEQFTQVFEAILEGKYSWACVLTLKFTGYNPLHYIPYRTYKRLIKENSRRSKLQKESIESSHDLASEVCPCTISPNSSQPSNQKTVDYFSTAK